MSPIDVKGGERARIRDGFPRTNCCSFGLVQVFQMGAGEGGGGRYFGQNPKEKQFCLGKPSHWGKPIYEVFFYRSLYLLYILIKICFWPSVIGHTLMSRDTSGVCVDFVRGEKN